MDKFKRRRIRRIAAKMRPIVESMDDQQCLAYMESPERIKITKHMPPLFHRQVADALRTWRAERS
jgi:hypothetical protein